MKIIPRKLIKHFEWRPMKPKSEKSLRSLNKRKGLLLLIIFCLWLVTGVLLHLFGYLREISQYIFIFGSNAGLSTLILLLAVLAYGSYQNKLWFNIYFSVIAYIFKPKKVKPIYILSVVALILFYLLLVLFSKWFSPWTGRTLTNEWILVLVSSIPLLIVLAFMLAGNISKVKIAGIELEFDRQIPDALLESFSLADQISRDFFMKGGREELDRIVRSVASSSKHPIFLLVPLEGANYPIDFKIMRQYIYKLAEVAPIQFIVFVGKQNRFLGFTTIDKFRATFPRFGIELVLEELENEKVQMADLPSIFNRVEPGSIDSYLERLIYRQWNPNMGQNWDNNKTVLPTDLTKLGASDQKANISASPSKVYWLLMEYDLNGIPIIDAGGKFRGIVTKERITQAVINQLLEKSQKSELKE